MRDVNKKAFGGLLRLVAGVDASDTSLGLLDSDERLHFKRPRFD
jgi:hypothetical protein